MYTTQTNTATYTVIDIRKTFEGFEADVRMIAKRTGKWTTDYVDKIVHDVIALAEYKYLKHVDVTLLNSLGTPLRANRFSVNEDGSAISSERPGQNDWPDIPDTRLTVIVSYNTKWHALSLEEREEFASDNNFKISWTASDIDTNYYHLQRDNGQLYASKGYELQKTNFK